MTEEKEKKLRERSEHPPKAKPKVEPESLMEFRSRKDLEWQKSREDRRNPKDSPRDRVRRGYAELGLEMCGDSESVAFVHVNFDRRDLRRNPAPLGLDFLESLRHLEPLEAYKQLWNRYWTGFALKALGRKGVKAGLRLKVFGSFENPTKSYDASSKEFHLHALVPIPAHLTKEDFAEKMKEYWTKRVSSRLTLHLGNDAPPKPVTMHIEWVTADEVKTGNYIAKQFPNFDIASERAYIKN